MWAKRVQKEIEELFKNTQELEKEGITLFPNEVNIQIFQGFKHCRFFKNNLIIEIKWRIFRQRL